MPTHPRQFNRLLIHEPPLQVIPTLAVLIGLNEAIFLQQLHYWLQSKSAKVRDDQVWIYNTYEEWHRQMPFWSERTIQRIVGNLVEQGLVLTTQAYNTSKMDKTNWYALDYEALARLTERVDDHDKLSSSERKFDVMEDDKVAPSSDKTETTPETTPERKRPLTIQEIEELEKRHVEIDRWVHPERYRGDKRR
jgi:hypothetical protein